MAAEVAGSRRGRRAMQAPGAEAPPSWVLCVAVRRCLCWSMMPASSVPVETQPSQRPPIQQWLVPNLPAPNLKAQPGCLKAHLRWKPQRMQLMGRWRSLETNCRTWGRTWPGACRRPGTRDSFFRQRSLLWRLRHSDQKWWWAVLVGCHSDYRIWHSQPVRCRIENSSLSAIVK